RPRHRATVARARARPRPGASGYDTQPVLGGPGPVPTGGRAAPPGAPGTALARRRRALVLPGGPAALETGPGPRHARRRRARADARSTRRRNHPGLRLGPR